MKNRIKLAKASLGAGLIIFTTGCGYYKQQSAQYEEPTILNQLSIPQKNQ